jgi:hypothetical protein
MLARGKGRAVKARRIIQVVAVGDTIKVGSGTQAFSGGRRLVCGMVAGVFFMGTGVVGGAVETKGHEAKEVIFGFVNCCLIK